MAVYNACVDAPAVLLCTADTLTLCKNFANYVISWVFHTPDTVVLEKISATRIEAHIHRLRLCWAGHINRIEDRRLLKQMLYKRVTLWYSTPA